MILQNISRDKVPVTNLLSIFKFDFMRISHSDFFFFLSRSIISMFSLVQFRKSGNLILSRARSFQQDPSFIAAVIISYLIIKKAIKVKWRSLLG